MAAWCSNGCGAAGAPGGTGGWAAPPVGRLLFGPLPWESVELREPVPELSIATPRVVM